MTPPKTERSEHIHTGTKISNGEAEPAAVRRVKRVVGISVIDAEFITTNIHISSDAASGFKLRSFNLFIAARPSGVAAFERPKRFAVILMAIALFASHPSGSEGNKKLVIGERSFSIFLVIPDFCAISNNPVHRHIMPSNDITVSTAFSAPEKAAVVTASVVPAKIEYM